MTPTEPKVDRDLLGRVAALTPGQQRWLRTVLQSVLTMEPPGERRADQPEERPSRPKPRTAEREAAEETPARPGGLDELLSGVNASEEDYPELTDELKDVGDIAELLRESGRERRRYGEEIMRLLEGIEGGDTESEEDEEDEGTRSN